MSLSGKDPVFDAVWYGMHSADPEAREAAARFAAGVAMSDPGDPLSGRAPSGYYVGEDPLEAEHPGDEEMER